MVLFQMAEWVRNGCNKRNSGAEARKNVHTEYGARANEEQEIANSQSVATLANYEEAKETHGVTRRPGDGLHSGRSGSVTLRRV